MRFVAVLLAGLSLVAAIQPALAYWAESKPGEREWPPIPGSAEMTAFEGQWDPNCNLGGIMSAGAMSFRDGKVSFRGKAAHMPTTYRVVEETLHYVILLMRSETPEGDEFILDFWALRPTDMSGDLQSIGINACPVWAELAERKKIWNGDAESLKRLWQSSRSCNPNFTLKSSLSPFWGEGWEMVCKYSRISDTEAMARDIRASDNRINVAYRHLMGALDEGAQGRLRNEQRAWLKTRDRECRLDRNEADRSRWLDSIVADRQKAACVSQFNADRIAAMEQALREVVRIPNGPWPQESPVKTFDWQAATGYWRVQGEARFLHLSRDGFLEAVRPGTPDAFGRVREVQELWTTGAGESTQEVAVVTEYRLCPGESEYSEFRVLALANDARLQRYLTFDAAIGATVPRVPFDTPVGILWEAFRKGAPEGNFRDEGMWRRITDAEVPSWFREMVAAYPQNNSCR